MRAPSAEPRLPARPAVRAAAIVSLVHALPLVDRAAFAAVLERVRADLWLTDLQLGLAASVPALVAGLLALRGARGAVGGRLRSAAAPALWGAAAALSGGRAARSRCSSRARPRVAPRTRSRANAASRRPSPPRTAYAWPRRRRSRRSGTRERARSAGASGGVSRSSPPPSRRWRSPRPPRGRAASPARLPRLPARARGSRAALAGGALVAFAAGALVTWTPAFLERARGVPRAIAPLETGAAVLMAGVAAAWARGAAAQVLRRAGTSHWLCPAAALAAAPLALAALLARRPVAYLVALVAVIALVLVALSALVDALAPRLSADRRAPAEALAWIALLGDAPASLVVGAISHRTSLWWAMLAVPAALLMGGALLARDAWQAGRGDAP